MRLDKYGKPITSYITLRRRREMMELAAKGGTEYTIASAMGIDQIQLRRWLSRDTALRIAYVEARRYFDSGQRRVLNPGRL